MAFFIAIVVKTSNLTYGILAMEGGFLGIS
jgi:hypothetical protein